MLAADPQIGVRPPADTWARLLVDEDLRVRSAALPLAAGRARADFIRIAPQLAEDSETRHPPPARPANRRFPPRRSWGPFSAPAHGRP